MVVQHHADDGLARIVLVQALEQRDELHTAVAVLDVREDVTRVQVDSGENRYRAPTDILIVAPYGGCLARYRRQIRCCQSDRLNTRLLVDADGVDGVGSRIVNGALPVDRDIPVDHQDFLHLAVELRVPFFQVVANLVGLDLVLVEDAPHSALASVGQASKSSGLGSFLAIVTSIKSCERNEAIIAHLVTVLMERTTSQNVPN